jgi:hypothetical protein
MPSLGALSFVLPREVDPFYDQFQNEVRKLVLTSFTGMAAKAVDSASRHLPLGPQA